MNAFEPRALGYHGAHEQGGWTLKLYSVRHGDEPVNWPAFRAALHDAVDGLPAPDDAAGRPGLGFAIAHQGATGDYMVVGWWNHENELPLAISVRRSRDEAWRPATSDESICVWDLEIAWHERQAWVRHMLQEGGPDPAAWLADTLPGAS